MEDGTTSRDGRERRKRKKKSRKKNKRKLGYSTTSFPFYERFQLRVTRTRTKNSTLREFGINRSRGYRVTTLGDNIFRATFRATRSSELVLVVPATGTSNCSNFAIGGVPRSTTIGDASVSPVLLDFISTNGTRAFESSRKSKLMEAFVRGV